MPSLNFVPPSLTTTHKIILITTIIIGGIAAIIGAALYLGSQARQRAQQNLTQQFTAPSQAVKEQVKKILYKRIGPDGQVTYIEILSSGHVNLYDANMRLIKSGIQGFSRINNLFADIQKHLDTPLSSGVGGNQLIIETNKGKIIIDLNPDDIDDDLTDILEEIEDITQDTFNPTPTPIPFTPPPTRLYSPTPIPSSPLPPTRVPPTITPGGPSLTPTPLPNYMTQPPFTCEEYLHLGRPVTISNTICGVE